MGCGASKATVSTTAPVGDTTAGVVQPKAVNPGEVASTDDRILAEKCALGLMWWYNDDFGVEVIGSVAVGLVGTAQKPARQGAAIVRAVYNLDHRSVSDLIFLLHLLG